MFLLYIFFYEIHFKIKNIFFRIFFFYIPMFFDQIHFYNLEEMFF